MRRDSRLSVALHVLLHMQEIGGAVTSETLGSLLSANPVVLRRTMGGLRDAGIVASEKGHGGGWSLARDLRTVTLGDVYVALGPTMLFGIAARDPHTTCAIEQAVNRVVDEAVTDAEAAILARLRGIAVADVLKKARNKASRPGLPHKPR